jgi:DNA-directed RNA polymerase subunit RPC12/RpoP
MTLPIDRQRRPTLHLKTPPPPAKAATAEAVWKCKPCGAQFGVDPTLADGEPVRCPGCNARLGRAEQFRIDPVETRGVRARMVA